MFGVILTYYQILYNWQESVVKIMIKLFNWAVLKSRQPCVPVGLILDMDLVYLHWRKFPEKSISVINHCLFQRVTKCWQNTQWRWPMYKYQILNSELLKVKNHRKSEILTKHIRYCSFRTLCSQMTRLSLVNFGNRAAQIKIFWEYTL